MLIIALFYIYIHSICMTLNGNKKKNIYLNTYENENHKPFKKTYKIQIDTNRNT